MDSGGEVPSEGEGGDGEGEGGVGFESCDCGGGKVEGEGVGDRRERVTGLVRGLWRLLVGVEEGEEGADVDTDPTPVVLSERADDRLIEKCQAIVR